MIKSFRHKGLKRFYVSGSTAGIQADHAKKLRMQLAALDTAISVEDMDIPGFRLHPLKGKDKERGSICINRNWRMTFEFRDGNAYIIDYEDYFLMTMHNPPHPGEFIREVYLAPFGISSRQLASRLGVSPSTLSRLLKGGSGISPEMSLRLSKVLGRTPESWLAMQDTYDLWMARSTINLDDLQPLDFEAA